MQAIIKLNLKVDSAEEGQRVLIDLGNKLKEQKLIDDYHFEIETPAGPVTEKCLLSEQKVIA